MSQYSCAPPDTGVTRTTAATSPNKKNRKLKARKLGKSNETESLYKRDDFRSIAPLSASINVPARVQQNLEGNNLEYKKYIKFTKRREEQGAEAVWLELQKERGSTTRGASSRLKVLPNNLSHYPIKHEEHFLREKRVEKTSKRLGLRTNILSCENSCSKLQSDKFQLQNTLFYAVENFTRNFLINLTHEKLSLIKKAFLNNKIVHENQKLVLVKPSGFIRAMRIDDNHPIGSNADLKNKRRLLQLFDRIDGSCTGRISWEQFMAYLAESADNNDILELDPQNGSAENNKYAAFESLVVPPFSTVQFINSLDCTVGYGGEKVKGVYLFWNTADEGATHASPHPKSQSTVCIGREYGKVLLLTTSNELSYLIIHFANLTIACYDLLSLEEKALVTVSHELTSMKYIHLDRSQFWLLEMSLGTFIAMIYVQGLQYYLWRRIQLL